MSGDSEMAAAYWAVTDPPFAWAQREGICAALVQVNIWNEIAMAAQYKGTQQHRKMGTGNPPAMEYGAPIRPELLAAYRELAREHGYEIVEVRENDEWFWFRVSPACWPPPGEWRQEGLGL